MSEPLSAGITGGLSIVGGLLGSHFSNKTAMASAAQQYQYNLALQQQAQQWQEYMSNTAHQREKADLIAAGLNPILTATGGTGASTGSVGANSVGMPQTFGLTASDIASTAGSLADTVRTLTNIPLEKYRTPLSFAGSLFEKFKGTSLGNKVLNFARGLFKGVANDVMSNKSTSNSNLFKLYASKDREVTPKELLEYIGGKRTLSELGHRSFGSAKQIKSNVDVDVPLPSVSPSEVRPYSNPNHKNSVKFTDIDSYIRNKYIKGRKGI